MTKETKQICEILSKLFSTEAIPQILQSDNGGEFVSNIIKHMMPYLGIKFINVSPYTATTQGPNNFIRIKKCLLMFS